MNQPKPYSWEELENRRTQLRKKVQAKEILLKTKCNNLFVAPPIESKMDLYFNYAKTAFTAYDGFRTGFKLLKSLGILFKRKKRKNKQ